MGDRANIFFVTEPRTAPQVGIYMYTHWDGCNLPLTLQAALKRGKDRWDDSQYLARIIFDEMIGQDAGLTGYGLSTQICDNEHLVIRVDTNTQKVSYHPAGKEVFNSLEGSASWSFEDYVVADEKTLLSAFGQEYEEDGE